MAVGETHKQRGPGTSGQGARGKTVVRRQGRATDKARCSSCPLGSRLSLTTRLPPRSFPTSPWSTKVSRGSALGVPEPPAGPCEQGWEKGAGRREPATQEAEFSIWTAAPGRRRPRACSLQVHSSGQGGERGGGGIGLWRGRTQTGGHPPLRTGHVSPS